MRLVWTPWASSWDWLRLKWLTYLARAFSSSSVNSPSSSAPSTAVSQAWTSRMVCSSWLRLDLRRVSVRLSRWAPPSKTAMAASLASSISRSLDALSSCPIAPGSAVSLPRASWSLNSLSRASSSRVTMPSATLWSTPSFQPSSSAWLTVSSFP